MRLVRYCNIPTNIGVLLKVVIDPTITTHEQVISKNAISNLDLRTCEFNIFSAGIIVVFERYNNQCKISDYDIIFTLDTAVSSVMHDKSQCREFRSAYFPNSKSHIEWLRYAIMLGVDIEEVPNDYSIINEAFSSALDDIRIRIPDTDFVLEIAKKIAMRYQRQGVMIIDKDSSKSDSMV